MEAFVKSLGVPYKVDLFHAPAEGKPAYERLLHFAESYFASAKTASHEGNTPKVQNTGLPPIFLQRPHHSLTIVGLEKLKDGRRKLLVFDPALRVGDEMRALMLGNSPVKSPASLLKPYERGRKRLKIFHAFETVSFA